MDAEDLKPVGTYRGTLILECDHRLSDAERTRLREFCDKAFPEGRVAVLEEGLRVARVDSEQLDRIEAMLKEITGWQGQG